MAKDTQTVKYELEIQSLKDLLEAQTKELNALRHSVHMIEVIAARPIVVTMTDNQIPKLAELLLSQMALISHGKTTIQ